jgi:hypothetical protein
MHAIAKANSAPIKRVFAGSDGRKALEVLERAFDGENLFVDDPYRTAYNLGARDVVTYIRQLNRYEAPKDVEIPDA